jgi:hypothetical protein
MKAIVICPDRRAAVPFLARPAPLALLPVLGPSLLSHWLTDLADRGIKEVTLLATDRPDEIRAAVGRGEKWGLQIEVLAEVRELSVAEARLRFSLENVFLADRLPMLPDAPLFESYAGFFAALQHWLPLAHNHRIGAREIAPGVWAGMRSKIDLTAELIPPCWLGENVWVRARAKVGPNALVEDSTLVDDDAEVVQSWIGPRTYVGALTQLRNSFAWANGLLNHASGAFTEIVDGFLLGDLRGSHGFTRSSPWYGRLAALLAIIVSSPLVALAALKNARSRQPLFTPKRAVIPTAVAANTTWREMDYRELNGLGRVGRRWPQLWNIVRGEFTWVGNRPVTREQARRLQTEFEQLWLAAPVGLFSLADALNCHEEVGDEARAHAGYYAVNPDPHKDWWILQRMLFSAIT